MTKNYKFISIEQIEVRGTLEVHEGKPVYRIFNKKEGTQYNILDFMKNILP